MTKLSHIIDTDAVYQAALRQLQDSTQTWGYIHDEAERRPILSRRDMEILRRMGDPFAPPAASAPATGPSELVPIVRADQRGALHHDALHANRRAGPSDFALVNVLTV